jgi:type VI secretion system protein ImpJ
MKLDETALANRSLVVEEGDFIFPDGTAVEFPGNAIIQPRSLDESLTESERPFKVFLGLKKWDEAENVTTLPNLEDVSGVNTRFVATADPEETPDLYGEGPPAQVKRLSYVLKIFWETEKDQLNKYHLIPIAQVRPEIEEVKLSSEFMPPVLQIDSYAPLLVIIKDIFDKVAARCRRLEEYKTPSASQTSSLEPGVFFLVMGLRTLSRYVLRFSHIMDAPCIHPWNVYGLLCQLAGELTSFSQNISASGENRDGKNVVPKYKHEDLAYCFETLNSLISQLLDEITFGPEAIIRLNYEDPYYVGEMEKSVFSDRNVYYLAVNTESGHKEALEAIHSVAKLSSKENLHILITRALPGLELVHLPLPPPGLPQISTTLYFRIDVSSTQWNDVQSLGNIALHWDTAPEDMVAEIIVMRRS